MVYGPNSVYDPSKWAGGGAHKVGMDPATLVNGMGYQFGESADLGTRVYGIPEGAKGAFPQAAGYLLQGAQQGQQNLIKSYEAAYRGQAQGFAAGQRETNDRMGGEVAAQGYSPDLVRRMLVGGQQDTQAKIGSAYGQNQAGLHQELATLLQGVGVDLAHLKEDQLNFIMQAYIAKKARKAAESAGWMNFAGSAIGAAGQGASGTNWTG